MAENDIVALKELASGGFLEVALAPADIGAATTASTVAAAKALADEFTGNAALVYTSEGGNGWTTLTEPASFRTALELGTAATADSTDFAPAVAEIEVPNNGTSTTTLTTGQLPARVIIFVDADAAPSATINLPTPGVRQSGLLASIKVQIESGSAASALITVVHDAVTLLNGYELDEDESSIDFLWDGYAWTYDSAYRLRSFPSRVLQLPGSSGTIARTEDFASPPSIGSTTPNSGAFTTLAANNGTLTASAPVLDLSQTWNNSGVTFTGLRFNVTNTANAATSLLADFQVGGTSVLKIGPDGALEARTNQAVHVRIGSGNDGLGINSGLPCLRHAGIVTFRASSTQNYLNNVPLGWSSSINGAANVILAPEAAATLAQRDATNPQTFRLYNTFTSATNFERLNIRWASNELIIDAEAGSGGGTLRGIKIGSATSSLLGFYGVTPVDQPATVADPAGGGTIDTEARTAINAVIDRLQELGLIA